MPETAYDEKYVNGVVVQSTPRTVSDEEIKVRDAPAKLLQQAAALDQLAADWAQWAIDAEAVSAAGGTPTAAQLRALFHRFAQTSDRLSTWASRQGDLIAFVLKRL